MGTYVHQGSIDLSGKQNITLDGLGLANWTTGQINLPFIAILGNCTNLTFQGINFGNTYVGSEVAGFSMIHGFEQGPNTGITIRRCGFTNPGARQNAITFVPYSPNNGVGNNLNNLLIQDNYAHDIGRCFVEIISHVHESNRSQSYVNDLIFEGNRVLRTGQKDPDFGMGCSVSGVNSRTIYRRNQIKDGKYAGLELISALDALCTDNWFDVSDPALYNFSGYGITKGDNNANKNKGVRIIGGGGTVTGRPAILYDIDNVTLSRTNFTAKILQQLLRCTGGNVQHNAIKVTADGAAVGISQSTRINVLHNTFELANTDSQQFSVLDLGGPNNNTAVTSPSTR